MPWPEAIPCIKSESRLKGVVSRTRGWPRIRRMSRTKGMPCLQGIPWWEVMAAADQMANFEGLLGALGLRWETVTAADQFALLEGLFWGQG